MDDAQRLVNDTASRVDDFDSGIKILAEGIVNPGAMTTPRSTSSSTNKCQARNGSEERCFASATSDYIDPGKLR